MQELEDEIYEKLEELRQRELQNSELMQKFEQIEDETYRQAPNSRPVTGMETIPIRNASIHQVQNVHTSPPRRYAESTVRSTAAVSSGNNSLIFFFIFFFVNLLQ